MARNPRRNDNIPFNHPSIIDIEIQRRETLINFKSQKIQPKPKVFKRKESEQALSNPNQQSQEDDKAEASGGKLLPKTKTIPEFLRATAKYNFTDKNVVLCMFDDAWEWSLVSITGTYDFAKFKIKETEFVEITGNDFVYNIAPTGNGVKAKVFKLNLSKIDRHILMKQFTIDISYIFLDDKDNQLFTTKYTFDLPYFQQETRLQFKFLGHYHADSRITTLYNYKFKLHPNMSSVEEDLLRELDQYQRKKFNVRTAGNTTQMIKYALNIEDLSTQDELKAFTLKNVHLDGVMTNYSFPFKKNQLPPNFEEMSLCLVPMQKYVDDKINTEDDSIFAQVDKVDNNRVFFEKKFPITRGVARVIDLDELYFVRFIPNRITYRACFQALDSVSQHLLSSYFDAFEDAPVNSKKDNGEPIHDFEWYNKQIATNEEQKTAIMNIVNCTAYPFPYVVFGPPGTGKTSCIVECIAQILKTKPAARIMVTAQSNSACDEVGERLLKYVSRNKIFRFYSPSLLNPENGETSAVLRETSNLRNKKNQYPTKEEFYHFNVVIVTLMSCSRFVQFDGIGMNRHFDYIFLDEAAAAMEPEAYVPIMGLGTDFQEITTNIVLLGDHKQLGAVVSSDIASRLGLGESLMERIMSKRRYRMNELDKSFDNNYVTQLLDNFRSHPAILQFSNVLFYESKLRAKIAEPEKSLGTRWNYLNNRKFPVLFHCVKTPSKIIKGGTSSFNEGEIKLVRFYVDLLLKVGIDGVKIVADDIGVVSPYKAQLNKLRNELQHERKVEIGTAEYYQGREKKIIIISTVKSRDNVGFLKSEKRLNVCITRAKSLLILIGNADTLQQNSMWNSFMHFCQANDGCCGEKFSLKRLTDQEQRVLDELNSVFSELSVNEAAETQPALDKDEKLKAIEERMEKLKLLMQRM